MTDFLDSIAESSRPEPNVSGAFDCMECREPVDDAHYDRRKQLLRWWCSQGHESVMEEVTI